MRKLEAKSQIKKQTNQQFKNLVQLESRVSKHWEATKKQDVRNVFLVLPDGVALNDRVQVHKSLLRGKYKIKFPAHIDSIDAKLYKLSEDPILF